MKGKLNKHIYVFVVCVLLATLFWLLSTLSGTFTSQVSVQVNYSNMPEDKVLVRELPGSIDMEVTAFGFDLLSLMMKEGDLRVDMDLVNYRSGRLPDGQNYILTQPRASQLVRQLGNQYSVGRIFPDTISYQFDKMVKRMVAVQVDHELSFDKQSQLAGPVNVVPDSVLVSGPGRIVNTLSGLPTALVTGIELSEDLEQQVLLVIDENLGNVKVDRELVTVTVPVEKFTEGSVDVPINLENVPDSISVRIYPDAVKVSYTVGLSKYEQVNSALFEVFVDYNEALTTNKSRLLVTIRSQPDFVQNVRTEPERVEYIVKK